MNARELTKLAEQTIVDFVGPQIRSTEEIELEYYNEWYESGNDAFYSSEEYPWLMLNCWRGWTNGNVRNTIKFFTEYAKAPKSFIDLGAGLGLSTIQLALAFPESWITYNNIPGLQSAIFRRMIKKLKIRNVDITYDLFGKRFYNVVCAYEVMEHFSDPAEFAYPILRNADFYIDASSFSIKSPGHFLAYEIIGTRYPNDETKTYWNKWLKTIGFQEAHVLELMPRSFYNKRPQVWARKHNFE